MSPLAGKSGEDGTSVRLDGRVAVVTGALGLLGRHHCRALDAAGARVVVTDLDAAGCRAFAAELSHGVGRALDVRDELGVEGFAREIEASVGPIEVLVNNAALDDKVGVTPSPPLELTSRERFAEVLEVNVIGLFTTSARIGARMARRGRGSIVNVASTYGVVAPAPELYREPGGRAMHHKSVAYPASKAAVLALTRQLAAHWGRSGVRVNALSPGGVEAGQDGGFVARYSARTPLGRMARAEEIARAVVFLASDASSYVTGANLLVDGGFTCW